jgi:hypothetical protein
VSHLWNPGEVVIPINTDEPDSIAAHASSKPLPASLDEQV